jgi:triacylglycerol lipase
MPKPRPARDVDLLLNPERDTAYVHFDNGAAHPFDANRTSVGRRNAWWLADAALLAYWGSPAGILRLRAAGFESELVDAAGAQAYVAWTAAAILVTFRGTEGDQWSDIFDDVQFRQEPWNGTSRMVHRGFKAAHDRLWPALAPLLEHLGGTRRVWFSGHSLGGALATLAADRYTATAGVCTVGSPRVGDVAFAAAFNARFGARALRYVNDSDIVTHVPPPSFFTFRYKHVGERRQIAADGTVSTEPPALVHFFNALIGEPQHMREVMSGLQDGTLTVAPKFVLDHMPRGYAVDIWNDYELHGD